jgi:hypothetical protein
VFESNYKLSKNSELELLDNTIESFSLTSGNVSSREGDHELFDLGAIGLRLWDDVLVDGFHRSLEASELGHRVGDLAAPQGSD